MESMMFINIHGNGLTFGGIFVHDKQPPDVLIDFVQLGCLVRVIRFDCVS